jgi:excinuclease UvrABC nuclease subunit
MDEPGRFEKWFPLVHPSVGQLVHNTATPGVYAIRLEATGEILYIGSSNNIRRRIFGNYIGGVGGETTQRIHELLFTERQIARVEVAWIEAGEYKDKEAELKEEYRKKHGHLPRWNKL